ncbi:MAG: FtsX-like permease family protein [Cytophagales bacterium]|nr:FtsX-like permease family protein [Cytophagales bacterium]
MKSSRKRPLEERILEWCCRGDFLEEILGDLYEYREELEEYPAWQRPWRFWFQAFNFIRPSLAKKLINIQKLNLLGMILHNFTITFRGFRRHKSSFLINLIGLSTGFAASILIALWVLDECTVDKFNANDDRLYRVMAHFQLPEQKVTWDYTSGRMARSMKEEFPEIDKATRINNHFFVPAGVLETPQGNLEIEGIFADPNLFDVLDYELITGDPATALTDLKSIVITQGLAEKLHGSVEGAMGKDFHWSSSLFDETFRVTGVVESPPSNASMQFETIINYQILVNRDKWADEWNGGYAETFLLLKEGVDPMAFEGKIVNYYDDKINNDRFTLFLQKFSDQYLYGDFEDGQLIGGRIENVRLFLLIAIFILVIASINFINLTTAQASIKLKEIGIKKSLGGSRQQLIGQFLQESITLSFVSICMAVLLVYGVLPIFNLLTGKILVLDLLSIGGYLFLMGLVLGLLAGIYPAFYLSSFSAIKIIRGQLSLGGQWIRKILVIIQFAISLVFIVEVLVIHQQLDFMEQKPLGYNRQNVLTFKGRGAREVDLQAFKNELSAIPGVSSVSSMMGAFLWGNDSGSGYIWNNEPENANYLFKSPKMGYGVLETLEIELAAGRLFDPERNDDRTKVIINESALKMMNIENPIGYKLGYGQGEEKREIIGVVKDFQYGSMHQEIEPVLIRFRENGRNFILRLEPGTEISTIDKIESLYSQFYPKYVFNGRFLDDSYSALYDTEQRIGGLSGYFALLAILISCLGLLGLATFTTARRVKEIGIRKVMGCETWRIIYLLTSDFTKMVLIAILIGIPLSYLAGNKWLENFAYAIDLEWWLFVLAGITALLIAWFTVGIYTVKAATANPVEALKDE